MHRIRIILLLLTLLTSGYLFGQSGDVPTKKVSGKIFHVHTVKKGQTLYGISKMYDVTINEVLESNPGKDQGLSIGDSLLIKANDKVTVTSDGGASGTLETVQNKVNQQVAVSDSTLDSAFVNIHSKQEVTDSVAKDYVLHSVKGGETLYSIARLYSVEPSTLLVLNNRLADKLSIGDHVKIPIEAFKKATANTDKEVIPEKRIPVNPIEGPGDSIILHRVKLGETIYGLAKQYNVKEDDIVRVNDGLPFGLKWRMKVRIPLKRKSVNEEINEANTVDSVYEEPVSDVRLIGHQSSLKGSYNVAIMLPLFLKEQADLSRNCDAACPMYKRTEKAMNMYLGAMLAIDSMRKRGLSLQVYVYDTRHDTSVVSKILKKSELAGMDLIFGPLYSRTLLQVARYAQRKGIRIVSPVAFNNKILFKRDLVTKMFASRHTQLMGLADYIARRHVKDNIMLFRSSAKNDKKMSDLMGEGIQSKLEQFGDSSSHIKILSLATGVNGFISISSQFTVERTNVLVVPSADRGYVSNFLTRLNSTYNSSPMFRSCEFVVYGLEEWLRFDNIDVHYKEKFNVHLPTSQLIDYRLPASVEFIKSYRAKFHTDPSKLAFMAFDVMYFHLKGMRINGTNFQRIYSSASERSLQTTFSIRQTGAGSGYENKHVDVVRYNEFNLERVR